MAKVWKIAPGEDANHWEMCRQLGCILIGWRRLRDYGKFKSEKQIVKALGGGSGYGVGAAQSIWRFTHDIQPSDIVIANKGRNSVVGIGVVKSEYLPPSSSKNPSGSEWLPHARLVKWIIDQPIDFKHDLKQYFFGIPTVYSLKAEKVGQLKQAYLKKYPKLKEKLDQLFDGIIPGDADDSRTEELLAFAEQQLEENDAFDPVGIKDARERILKAIVRRRGQPAFRKHLLVAYEGRCAITGCEVEAVLEAAHIIPFKGSQTNHPGNGLLLRADLHTLFDLRLVAVDVATMCLLVSSKLAGTYYDNYRGKRILIPNNPVNRPSQDALEQHRQKSGLSSKSRRRTRRCT